MRQSVYEIFFRFFASLKLTIAVLSLLFLACFVGMFWDQTVSLEDYLNKSSMETVSGALLQLFELNDVFHSWWFGILVLLLALNLIACSIERLPPIWWDARWPSVQLTDKQMAKLPQKAFISMSSIDKAEDWISALGFKKVATGCFFKEKHPYARCGVYLVHIALLLIMFGSILTTTFGVDGLVMIEEGTRQHIIQAKGPNGMRYPYDLGFSLSCQDFRLKTFTDNSPMAYESDLAIFEPASPLQPVVRKTIRVNDPLEYKGYTFYQSSFQAVEDHQSLKLAIGRHGQKPRLYEPKIGEAVVLPDGDKFVPLELIQDYGGLGEAVRIQYWPLKEEKTSFVVFRQYPELDPYVRRGKWDVFFQGLDQRYATGISIGKVPFLRMVFAGFIVMFIGLYMAFIQSQRRYYAKIQIDASGGVTLFLAGIARRHIYAFAEEFQALVEQARGK